MPPIARSRSFDYQLLLLDTFRDNESPKATAIFYIANDIVIVPTFGYRETDEAALHILGELMPDRTMVPIDAGDLIWGRGAFHCVTQQQPRPR